MSDQSAKTLALAEALCMAFARRHEPRVAVPWVSRYRDIQWAMDDLRCHLTGDPLPPRAGPQAPAEQEGCSCPTNEAGDIRCHVCGEYVNKRCWNCKTPRGVGPCPSVLPATADDEGVRS